MIRATISIIIQGQWIAAILLAGAFGSTNTARVRAKAALAKTCNADASVWHLEFEAGAIEAIAGERVALSWSKSNGRWSEYLAPECLTDWKVSDPGLATLSSDRRSITISDVAKAEQIVTISVRFAEQQASASIRVRRTDEPVLAGLWRRTDAVHCLKPPAELWFGRNGRFSYTFPEHMMETMQSGSGAYTWDWRAGSVTVGQMRGRAERIGAILSTEGLEFGWPQSSISQCKITFQQYVEKSSSLSSRKFLQ